MPGKDLDPSGSSHGSTPGSAAPTHRVALVILLTISLNVILTTSLIAFLAPVRRLQSRTQPEVTVTSAPRVEPDNTENFTTLAAREEAKRSPTAWLDRLRATSPNGSVITRRVGCREYDSGGQSCTFEGFVCMDTTTEVKGGQPITYFVDESKPDGKEVSSDIWCSVRYQSAHPRYYYNRHWPIGNPVAPQWSCLKAYYRTAASLFGRRKNATKRRPRIKWMKSLWLVHLDNSRSNHNYSLFMEIIWLLEVVLFQRSLTLETPPDLAYGPSVNFTGDLFTEGPRHVYLPQSKQEFIGQMTRDVNRLFYALILERDLADLYPNFTAAEMRTPPEERRFAAPFLEAYPDLMSEEYMLFHKDLRENSDTDLVCTPRFVSGAKLANGGHERTCRRMRQLSHKFYGIKEPPKKRMGNWFAPQPPKRIVILNRHRTRGIGNLIELEKRLRKEFEKRYDIEVEVVRTDKLESAEEWVRVFSRAGLLITPHGSQAQGMIWMPRHSTLIEIMPVGYSHYALMHMTPACQIQYYELQSMRNPNKTQEYYEEKCGTKRPHLLNPCVAIKNQPVFVNIEKAVKTMRLAMERMGYPMDPWEEFLQEG